ncbi:hypothetical protein M5K25_000013 [Dendrobium thyrsiflorum]|uniref:Uncharacterized protein n=1 Tax=Dendrobium thyrsiflorum TaxID=117978 RepID=A0ABD0W4C4_DENTH
MQKENYIEAEAAYRKALMISPDNNKMCNLGICLMKQGRITEANATLKQVRPAVAGDGIRGADSHLKAFDRAQEMLRDLESKMIQGNQASNFFEAFLGSSLIWQPQPCIDHHQERFADENLPISNTRNNLNIDAPPFYSKIRTEKQREEGLGNLKRTRSGILNEKPVLENGGGKWPKLPEEDEFQEAMVAAVLAPVIENGGCGSPALGEGKIGKRLRIFRDITWNMNAV